MTAAITSFIAPVAPQQAVAAPAPQAPHKGFAQMLSQRQAMAHESTAPAAKPAEEPSAPQPAASHPAAKVLAGERPPAKADKAKAPRAAESPADKEASVTHKADATASADSEPADPALADWLAALNLPPAPTPPEPPAATVVQGAVPEAGLPGKPGADAVAASDAAGAKARARTAIDAVAGNNPRSEASHGSAERLHAARESREKPDATAADPQAGAAEWQAAVERVNAPAEAQVRNETPSIAALGAATHTPTAAHPAEPAAPVAVSMPTPATAPEFAQSLGLQVSVLARDGVQQAELHLNPAEMGPISVHISLDGTQAQVNFGADSAATRQVIEGGLPELAAALRDAGFTLSGGGVHSQARGRGEGGNAPDDGVRREALDSRNEVSGVTQKMVNLRAVSGGVDTYA